MQATHTHQALWIAAKSLCQLCYQISYSISHEHAQLRLDIRRSAVAITTLSAKTLQSSSQQTYSQHQRSSDLELLELLGHLSYAHLVRVISNQDLQLCRQLCKNLKRDFHCGWESIQALQKSINTTSDRSTQLANIA